MEVKVDSLPSAVKITPEQAKALDAFHERRVSLSDTVQAAIHAAIESSHKLAHEIEVEATQYWNELITSLGLEKGPFYSADTQNPDSAHIVLTSELDAHINEVETAKLAAAADLAKQAPEAPADAPAEAPAEVQGEAPAQA